MWLQIHLRFFFFLFSFTTSTECLSHFLQGSLSLIISSYAGVEPLFYLSPWKLYPSLPSTVQVCVAVQPLMHGQGLHPNLGTPA